MCSSSLVRTKSLTCYSLGQVKLRFSEKTKITRPLVKEKYRTMELIMMISPGQRFGAEVIGYYFAVQLEQSLERNRTRGGKASVLDVALFATLKRLTRPSYAEGFTRLFYVSNQGEQTFTVSDWKEEMNHEHS